MLRWLDLNKNKRRQKMRKKMVRKIWVCFVVLACMSMILTMPGTSFAKKLTLICPFWINDQHPPWYGPLLCWARKRTQRRRNCDSDFSVRADGYSHAVPGDGINRSAGFLPDDSRASNLPRMFNWRVFIRFVLISNYPIAMILRVLLQDFTEGWFTKLYVVD